MSDSFDGLLDVIERKDQEIEALKDELRDAKADAANSDLIILREAERYGERARALRMIAGRPKNSSDQGES